MYDYSDEDPGKYIMCNNYMMINTSVDTTFKRGCIEFKYYDDAIHSGLTPPAISHRAGLTIADPPG